MEIAQFDESTHNHSFQQSIYDPERRKKVKGQGHYVKFKGQIYITT